MRIRISVAGIICELHDTDNVYRTAFPIHYIEYAGPAPSTLRIQIKRKRITKPILLVVSETGKNTIYVSKMTPPPFRMLHFFIKACVQLSLLQHDVLLLHGSSFTYHDKGYVFMGPSGAGKSTLVSHVPPESMYGDDTAVIRKIGTEYAVYPSPFDKEKCPLPYPTHAPLDGLFMLRKAGTATVTPLAEAIASGAIHSCNFLHEYIVILMKGSRLPALMLEKKLTLPIRNLVRSTFVAELRFNKSGSFLPLIHRV